MIRIPRRGLITTNLELVYNSGQVYEVRMKLSTKILFGFLLFATAQACDAQNRPSPLLRHISHFRIGPTSVLNALLWLGHDNGVCFGIEYSGLDLNNNVQVDENETTVGEVIRKILGSAYQISVSEGIVLIRKKGALPPSWLDHRLSDFKIPKVQLMIANASLFMALENDLDKSKKGFGGDFHEADPRDEVGPFAERGKTVNQLLIKLMASSHGASWFPTSGLLIASFPASINHFWTLATYSSPNLSRPR